MLTDLVEPYHAVCDALYESIGNKRLAVVGKQTLVDQLQNVAVLALDLSLPDRTVNSKIAKAFKKQCRAGRAFGLDDVLRARPA